jgi:hypothetical protein
MRRRCLGGLEAVSCAAGDQVRESIFPLGQKATDELMRRGRGRPAKPDRKVNQTLRLRLQPSQLKWRWKGRASHKGRTQNRSDSFSGKRLSLPTAGPTLSEILGLAVGRGLPLHVPCRVRAARAERDDVVADIARAGTRGGAGGGAGVLPLELAGHFARSMLGDGFDVSARIGPGTLDFFSPNSIRTADPRCCGRDKSKPFCRERDTD